MDNDTKPSGEGQIKTIPRKARGKAVYRPPVPPADTSDLPAEAETEPAPVAHPEIGEHDVQIDFRIELRTRTGTHFCESDKSTLPGLLDPENRGHMARVMERRFEEMRDLAVQGFNRLIEQKLKEKEQAAKAKPPAEDPRPIRKFQHAGLIGGASGEPAEETLAPLPKPPGTFHPPLNPVPPSSKN